ncbi:MAG TPA: serine hydrolase [Phycisphaerae bacterium]|nr:serine hydrolase [Phycisphaerae bacterium]
MLAQERSARSRLGAAAWMIVTAAAPCMAEPAWPGKTWPTRTGPQAGLDAAKLAAFSEVVGGRGCVVRGGYMVHTWGDAAKRGDVASAAKVFYSHFLFKAVELGKLKSVDEKAVTFEPRLAEINAALGHKDREITFRHFANQTSCYGLAERPGTAYAYNDWQMALFWDTLFGKIYGATHKTADEKVFAALLTDPLGCQDQPTMMAFGGGDRAGRVAISPRDFCRFGLLYLRGGLWGDQRLIGERFTKMAAAEPLPNSIPRAGKKAAEMIPHQRSIGSRTLPDNQTDHMGSYSWLWWTNGVDREQKRHWPDAPKDAFGAFGHGGIRAMVILPSQDLIVSWNDSRTRGREKENEALKMLVGAIRDAEKGAPGPRGARGPSGTFPGKQWDTASPEDVGMDAKLLAKARDYALKGDGSGCIVRHGKLVMRWGDPKKRYDLKSSTKALGLTALGLAFADGKIALADKARKHHPALEGKPEGGATGDWADEITIFHLATQTAGYDKPGGTSRLLFRPGAKWSYSDSGPNWLAECVTLAYKRDLSELLSERVFTPLGITSQDLTWRRNAYRPAQIAGVMRREFGSGISANVEAMARIGLLYLREGRWGEKQLLPKEFVAACRATPKAVKGLPVVNPKAYGAASDHYGLLWWNNNDAALKSVPTDAYWSWGLYDSLTVVIPSLDVVIARAGKSFPGDWGGHYDKLAPFLDPIVAAVKDKPAAARGPAGAAGETGKASHAPSPVIRSLSWAPKETILRRAKGGDNWPITWADDGHLYTAYGDGWGFEPKVKGKLSLGLARVEGPADAFRGVNVRSATGEQKGDGAGGRKASGMLCVDGVLYMLVRNAKLSQLAWSEDHGRSWTWADWRFTEGFACPTFLNFGRDYAAARDEYVYVYSFDGDSAYKPSGRMVLARVPKARLRERGAYEFFAKLDAAGGAVWTKDVSRRGAVFEHAGRCYRSHVSYNAPLRRYLWVQVLGGSDTRFAGGLAVFDAPEPWGPWTCAYWAEPWDVGPGESASFPPKWISADGRTLHLVFSGDDSFSVRKATLALAPPEAAR